MVASRASPDAKRIFLDCLDHGPPAVWAAFLEQACQDDAALRERVQQLLAAHQQQHSLLDTGGLVDTAPQPASECPGTQIGPYKLREQIGEGGMGVVYLAEQTEPVRRRVALKIIKAGLDTRQTIARFEAERQALALMDHPNIARILDAGTVGGEREEGGRLKDEGDAASSAFRLQPSSSARPFFVMELVRGLPITDYCDQAAATPRERLELFIDVCHAVQHAHQKGIIHRDLKPSNVMITLHDGKPVVKVIDFGIAKAIGQQLTEHTIYTAHTQLIGTPLYMSPEQAELSGLDVDTRSDVYSLGVLLYELLTGTTPFDKERLSKASFDEMRRIIREDEPARPSHRLSTLGAAASSTIASRRGLDNRRLTKLLRGELDWIVLKALEKARNRRYGSVAELAADITRYLQHEPIQARRSPWWLKAVKWRRRNPATAIALAGGLLLTIALVAGMMWHSHELGQALLVSNQLREAGVQREALLRREMYTNDMRLAWQAATAGDYPAARRLLDRHQFDQAIGGYIGFEWHYLRRLTKPPLRSFAGHQSPMLAAHVSPDERLLASSDRSGEIRIVGLRAGELVKSLRYADQEVTSVRFSPDGKWLATGGKDRTVRIWDVSSWQEFARLEGHEVTVACVAWSPDSTMLVSSCRGGEVFIWNASRNWSRQSLARHADAVRVVSWSPDGRSLATADGKTGVRLWDTTTWEQRGFLPFSEESILCIAFSPDSRFVAYSGYYGQVEVGSVETCQSVAALKGPAAVWSLTFWGPHCLVGGLGREGLMFLHFEPNAHSLTAIRPQTTAMGTVRSVIVLDDSRTLITATEEDRTISFWDATAALGLDIRPVGEAVAVVPRRGLAIVPDKSRTLVVRDLFKGDDVARLPSRASDCPPSASLDQRLLAAAEGDSNVSVIDIDSGRTVRQLAFPPGGRLAELRWSANNRWLASGDLGRRCGCWDLTTGEWRQLKHTETGEAGLVAFAPLPHIIACSIRQTPGIDIYDLKDDKLVCEILVDARVLSMRFTPDGRTLMVGETGSDLSLWDATTGHRIDILKGHAGGITQLAISPDGRTLASASEDQTVRLWSLATRRELFTLCEQTPVRLLSFLGDGSLLVVGEKTSQTAVYPVGPGLPSSPVSQALRGNPGAKGLLPVP